MSKSKTNTDKTNKDINSEDQSNSIEKNDIKPLDEAVEKAIEFFMMAAEQDDADAQHNIGMLYDNGQGVD